MLNFFLSCLISSVQHRFDPGAVRERHEYWPIERFVDERTMNQEACLLATSTEMGHSDVDIVVQFIGPSGFG